MCVEEAVPLVIQCSCCSWWWFFWDQAPTMPFVCHYCKIGEPVWVEIRKETPTYGTPRARRQTIPFGLEEEVTRTVIVEPPAEPKKRRRKKR